MQSTTDGHGEIVFSAEQDGGAGVRHRRRRRRISGERGGNRGIGLKAAEAFQANSNAVRVTTEERRLLMIAH
jgi:hypothetical protein